MDPAADNPAIIARCAALGLSLAQVQRLAGADHSLQDLAWVLGLDPVSMAPLKPRRWLWMAATTSSVSYRVALTTEGLAEVLTTGTLLPADASTFLHFLEEAPIQVVVMAVEQVAQENGVPIAQIWRNMDQIAAAWSSTRFRATTASETHDSN